ncbi:MAG: hypothetical protein LUI09_05980 [Prevotellaceae bacterium]|nr:hypothetical protein [Prevotellaceae bacterium]
MKRFIYAALLFIVACMPLSARDMPAIAGVSFGSSYQSCKDFLDRRFNGGKSSYQSDANRLTYYEVEFGGQYYSYVEFEFQTDGYSTFLSYIEFDIRYEVSEVEAAKKKRDALYAIYSNKYDFRWDGTTDDGFKYYILGHDPLSYENGFVGIGITKAKTKAGDMKIWVNVSYGPVNFINPIDEI